MWPPYQRHCWRRNFLAMKKAPLRGHCSAKWDILRLADGGTLFLDEIGDMPPEVQVKFLRVLQDGMFQRLGGTRTLQASVRVVAATNKNWLQEITAQRFRHDLYYRLNVIAIRLPPLARATAGYSTVSSAFLAEIRPGKHQRGHWYPAGSLAASYRPIPGQETCASWKMSSSGPWC